MEKEEKSGESRSVRWDGEASGWGLRQVSSETTEEVRLKGRLMEEVVSTRSGPSLN